MKRRSLFREEEMMSRRPSSRPILRLSTPPDTEQFERLYLEPGVPVIIENGFEWWEARRWTLEFLAERCKDRVVHVRKNTKSEDYRRGLKYDIEQMKFFDYIHRILRQDNVSNYYLAVQNIKRVLPEINADIEPLPPYIQKLHQGPFLWVAPSTHYEYTHIDPDDGMLFLIRGEKRVRLFGFDDFERLYPNSLGAKGRTIQSSVDLDDPDYERHPLFAGVACEEGVLRPGDMLFIPAFYWHQVTSDAGTIAVNVFFGDRNFSERVFRTRYRPLEYWVLNVVEQNVLAPSFARVLGQLESALREFFFKQWHEEVQPEHLQKLVAKILECHGRDCKSQHAADLAKRATLKIRGLLWRN